MIGGKIPNYKEKHEKIVYNLDNVYNSYLPLQRNLYNLHDIYDNLIIKGDTNINYKINTDFQLEELKNDSIIVPEFNVSDKKFKIADKFYPYYYVFLDNKFKIVEELYNKNKDSRTFLNTLFIISNQYDGIYYTFHDINSKENILHKYLFINKFKFLLDILFDENIYDDNYDRFNTNFFNNYKDVNNNFDKILDKILDKFKKNKKEIVQQIKINPNDNDLKKKLKDLLTNTKDEKYDKIDNKIKNIKNKLLEIFRIDNDDMSKYSLQNLNDLNKYQNILFENKKSPWIQRINERLDKYSKEDMSKDYLFNEILQIMEFRDNLERVTNGDKELALIIVLSYFYKRIYHKPMIYQKSFPINKNLA